MINTMFGAYDILVIWKKADILYNFHAFDKFFTQSAKLDQNSYKQTGITIKNDLYGAPLHQILPDLSNNCNHFFVATLQEAIEARGVFQYHNKEPNIYLLHGIIKGQEKYLLEHNIIPCINTFQQLNQWISYTDEQYVLHLDTGMSRHGISISEAQLLQNSSVLNNAKFYMSHFYGIKDDFQNFEDNIHNKQSTYTKQVTKMKEFLRILPPKAFSFSATDSAMAAYFINHDIIADNKSTITTKCKSMLSELNESMYDISIEKHSRNEQNQLFHENIIRPGVGIIGGVPTEKYLHFLKQAFSVYARISSISHINPGENIGYGIHSYDEKKVIAVMNIGYGDGYMKLLTGQNICLHNNSTKHLCKVIAINLNCSIIDITHISEAINTELAFVEICGETIDIREFAIRDGCYQVYSGLGSKGKNKKTVII